MNSFKDWASGKDERNKFSGVDGVTPEVAGKNSAWFFGIEPGFSLKDMRNQERDSTEIEDKQYSIERQLSWRFNQGVFKLIGSIEQQTIRNNLYKEYAKKKRFFETDSSGYVKANIYPVAANNVGAWSELETEQTGFPSKDDYYNWCSQERFPLIQGWMQKYTPRYVVAFGITQRDNFAQAILGKKVNFECEVLNINGHNKTIYYYLNGDFPFFVLPHLTGGRYGLNSYDAIEGAGYFINQRSTSV